MITTEPALSKSERGFLAAILALILVLVAFDLLADRQEGATWAHLLPETFVAAGAALGIVLLLRDAFRSHRALHASKLALRQNEQDLVRYREESEKYVKGLGQAIDLQLERWKLSASEKEVALLLLKGLSLKEIAEARHTTEKTARAQSAAVYEKAGLAGRSELSAFFLEDLLAGR